MPQGSLYLSTSKLDSTSMFPYYLDIHKNTVFFFANKLFRNNFAKHFIL